jgi:hypothetical protein
MCVVLEAGEVFLRVKWPTRSEKNFCGNLTILDGFRVLLAGLLFSVGNCGGQFVLHYSTRNIKANRAWWSWNFKMEFVSLRAVRGGGRIVGRALCIQVLPFCAISTRNSSR